VAKKATRNLNGRRKHRVVRMANFVYKPLLNLLGTKFTMGVLCDQHTCGKYIPSDAAWFCGYCDCNNTQGDASSFLDKCAMCGISPKSYICPHCTQINFLDEEPNSQKPARIVWSLKPTEGHPDEKEQKHREFLESKEALEREIEIAALNKRLVRLKDSPEFKQEVSVREKLEKTFSDFDAQNMGIQMLERQRRREYAEEFQDEPEILEMKNLMLDAFVRRFGLTPNRNITE
jgi:hypothetical protein